MTFIKIVKPDLDSLCQELSNGDLGIAIALSVFPATDFLCISTGDPIQLHLFLLGLW